ncbi:MAG: hypothetical protein ACRDK1_09640 [Solirubrobacterales bacterium]
MAEQATKRRGGVRRFMAWLGYGLEIELEQRPERDARRTRRKAEAAERTARRQAERRAKKEARRKASERPQPVEITAQEASERGPWRQAATGAAELEERLSEMESRARSAEQQAEEARARVAAAQVCADRARAAAEEVRHGIGAISTELARVEAERRLHEQAERRLVSRCAELGGELKLERNEKTVIVDDLDRRLAAIEETAQAATKRVAVARAVAHPGRRIARGSTERAAMPSEEGPLVASLPAPPGDAA